MPRILLIKRGALGDILMTTPLIRQLRQNLPDAQIDYCLAKPFVPILQENKYISKFIPLDDKIFGGRSVLKLIRFIFSIKNNYDYIFILGKSWQFNLIAMLFSGCRVGYVREKVSRFLLNKYVVYNDVNRYHALYYLDLLQASGLALPDYDDIALDLAINKVNKQFVVDRCINFDIKNFVVVVNSGGNNEYESGGIRMLPEDKILELLSTLLQRDTVILLGGNIDKHNYQEYLLKLNYPKNLFNWAGELNLAQSCYLISLADKFYTTDCGAMHLGVIANLGKKMVTFFAPTCPYHVLPRDKEIDIYWPSQNIFDSDYPLYGKIKPRVFGYFKDLKIQDIIM